MRIIWARSLSRSNLIYSSKPGGYHSNPLLPKRFQIKDSRLLDEQKIKNRSESFLKVQNDVLLSEFAHISYTYQKVGNLDFKLAVKLMVGITIMIIFAGAINFIQNVQCDIVNNTYGKKDYEELFDELKTSQFSYNQMIGRFVAGASESIMTHNMSEYLAHDLKKDKVLFSLARSVIDMKEYLSTNLLVEINSKRGQSQLRSAKYYAREFQLFYVQYPNLTLKTMNDFYASASKDKNIVIHPKKYLTWLLLNRGDLPGNIKLELVELLQEFHGITEYIMDNSLSEEDAYRIVMFTDDDSSRKPFTDKSRNFLKEILKLKNSS